MADNSSYVVETFRTWARDLYAPQTVVIYYRYVNRLSEFCDETGRQIELLQESDIAEFATRVSHLKPASQQTIRHALECFYSFLASTGQREDNPIKVNQFASRSRTKVDRRRPRPPQVAQKLASLAPRDQAIALLVSELLERGASLDEIFSIHSDVPVGNWVEVQRGSGIQRQFPLSDYARARLNDWSGELPINLRGFQRITAKVGLRPLDLGDPLRPGLGNIHLMLLPDGMVHPALERRARPAFLRGEYDSAVFQAMKAVEIAVRRAGKLDATDIGTPMMRKAFDIRTGPLRDPNLVKAERQATSDLFAGAIGLFKNPSSHRDIDLEDPVEVSGLLRLADVLLRIVDRAAGADPGRQRHG